jgi:hypothetical protein
VVQVHEGPWKVAAMISALSRCQGNFSRAQKGVIRLLPQFEYAQIASVTCYDPFHNSRNYAMITPNLSTFQEAAEGTNQGLGTRYVRNTVPWLNVVTVGLRGHGSYWQYCRNQAFFEVTVRVCTICGFRNSLPTILALVAIIQCYAQYSTRSVTCRAAPLRASNRSLWALLK